MRVLLFNIHRDRKKSKQLHAYQVAPDLFGNPQSVEKTEQDVVDDFGAQLMGSFEGFGSG